MTSGHALLALLPDPLREEGVRGRVIEGTCLVRASASYVLYVSFPSTVYIYIQICLYLDIQIKDLTYSTYFISYLQLRSKQD